VQEEELQRLGLDASKAYRLDTAETAEALHKKKEKKPAPSGWWVARGVRVLPAGFKALKACVCSC
jgi:hypothetical protein